MNFRDHIRLIKIYMFYQLQKYVLPTTKKVKIYKDNQTIVDFFLNWFNTR